MAVVLKTTGLKAMGVRLPHPPPSLRCAYVEKRERVAAVDRQDRKTIIAIGADAKKVAEKARKSGKIS